MKKNTSVFFPAVMFFLLAFSSSCMKTGEAQEPTPLNEGVYEILNSTSQVMYFHYEDLTYMAMKCRVQSLNETGGTVTSWRFLFKSGKRELLEVNNANYLSYSLIWNGLTRIPKNNLMLLSVGYSDEAHDFFPYSGRLFADIPTRIDGVLTIQDDNGNVQAIEFSAPVIYNYY